MTRRITGNTLILIVAGVMLVALIAFLILNYNRLLLTHKEVQSSIDAAALTAAKDISRIAVRGANYGTVALVDDPSNSSKPVLGINTILATIRLDLIIAQKLNNSTMAVAAAEDLQKAIEDSRALRKAILTACRTGEGEDKDGKPVPLLADVKAAYKAMSVRTGRGILVGDPIITAGEPKDKTGMTNTPVPSGLNSSDSLSTTDADAIKTSMGTVYKPYIDIKTPITINNMSHQFHFQFTGLANEVTLMSNDNYQSSELSDTASFLAPSLVQVTASEQLSPLVAKSEDNTERKKLVAPLSMTSTAQAGGLAQQFPSGALLVSFHGFPGQPPSTPPVSFDSIKGIINASQISTTAGYSPPAPPSWAITGNAKDSLGIASPYTGWNKQSPGNWFSAKNGTVSCAPDSGGSGLSQDPPAYRGRSHDDPSVVLAFVVYDWLKHAYLRPDVSAVVNALSSSFWSGGGAAVSNNPQWIQPTYANSTSEANPASFAISNVPLSGQGDPRDQSNFASNPDAYRRQLANVFGYVPAEPTLPDTSLLVSIQPGGEVTTTNGRDIKELVDLWKAIENTNELSRKTIEAAVAVLEDRSTDALIAHGKVINITKEIVRLGGSVDNATDAPKGKFPIHLDSEVLALPPLPTDTTQRLAALNKLLLEQRKARNRALFIVDRAHCALRNADYALALSLGMLNDRKAVTALGVRELSPQQFQIIGGTFYPPQVSASKEAISGEGPVSTGQDASAKLKDWCTPIKDGHSQVSFFVDSKEAQIGHQPLGKNGDIFCQRALAASAEPPEKNIFKFVISGDSSKKTGGTVSMSKLGTSPFTCEILSNQAFYQNTAGWAYPADKPTLVANCVARNQGSTANGGYFASGISAESSGPNVPPLIGEWSLRCPVPSKPEFCTIANTNTLQVNLVAGDMGHFPNVTTKVDAAGNISYYWQGQPMHFAQDAATWTAMEKAASATWVSRGLRNGIYGGSGNMMGWTNPAELGNFAAAHGVADSRYRGAVLFDGMTDDVAALYFAQYGTPRSNINQIQTWGQTQNYLWDAYNAAVFWVESPDKSCAQLFAWSS